MLDTFTFNILRKSLILKFVLLATCNTHHYIILLIAGVLVRLRWDINPVNIVTYLRVSFSNLSPSHLSLLVSKSYSCIALGVNKTSNISLTQIIKLVYCIYLLTISIILIAHYFLILVHIDFSCFNLVCTSDLISILIRSVQNLVASIINR